jgi:OCT family organic cation transporter-like MFS transporter 4/5
MGVSDVIELVVPFGRYQQLVLVLIGSISALVAMNIYSSIFMTAEPVLLCESNKHNESFDETSTCEIWSNLTKDHNYSDLYNCTYDRTYYDKTIITEWDLFCKRSYLASMTQMFFMIGTVSGILSGVISDRYGRRISCIIFVCLMSASLVVSQLLLLKLFNLNTWTHYIIFSINQFFCGILVNCLYCTAYVLLLELTTNKYHTIVSSVNLYFWVFGELVVLFVYYITRNWYSLYWFIAIYSVVIVCLTIFILPESPIWLLVQKRDDEAKRVLKQIARVNGKKLIDANFIALTKRINDDDKSMRSSSSSSNTNSEAKLSAVTIFKHIFCKRESIKKIYLLIYIWVAISLLYFGVSLGITSLDFINPYLIYLISSVFEVIGLSLCYLNDRIGRKKALLLYLTIASITCSIVAIIPKDNQVKFEITTRIIIKMALALIGKCMVSAAFNTCNMFTVESYPTNVRNTVILFLTCIGGIGSLISPHINSLRSLVWQPLPYIIFSACSFLACFCLLFLPETQHVEIH